MPLNDPLLLVPALAAATRRFHFPGAVNGSRPKAATRRKESLGIGEPSACRGHQPTGATGSFLEFHRAMPAPLAMR